VLKFFKNINSLFFDRDRWEEIWLTITHNKSRSFLTAFGVFWGMFMLVAMVGAGAALKNGIFSQIEGFATNSCFVFTNPTSQPYHGFRKGRYWNITNEDIPVIVKNVPEIQYIAPMIEGSRSEHNVSRDEYTGTFGVQGQYPVFNKINENKMLYGRYINDIDIDEKRKVCLIGERVYEVLFPTRENPVGKYIKVNGIYFQIIGVPASNSNVNLGGDAKETVTLPFTTMQQAFNMGNAVHLLSMTAKPNVRVKVIEDKVLDILKSIHYIAPDDKAAVRSFNIEDEFTMFMYLTLGIGALIWFVGGGTLLAGGIGISNIMLVTIRERTREIGIRRALGATPATIIGQIISESIILTAIAGVSGLMLGVGVLQIVGILFSQGEGFFKEPQISFGIAMASFAILVVIGLLAGYMPARRAMKIKAIEAIREE
jgi:putative ABC transport system permease protein